MPGVLNLSPPVDVIGSKRLPLMTRLGLSGNRDAGLRYRKMTRTVAFPILWVLATLPTFAPLPVGAREPDELRSSALGIAFGSSPGMLSPRISPDGSMIAFLKADPWGTAVGRVLDTATGSVHPLVSPEHDNETVAWCGWANETRLLCGLQRTRMVVGRPSVSTRMIAVNADGTGRLDLMGARLENALAQVQDRVMNWLPDDPAHVLVEEPGRNCSGISTLNIYDGRLRSVERCRGRTYRWITDSEAVPRLFRRTTPAEFIWNVRRDVNGPWEELRRKPITDIEDIFVPAGFADDPDELLYFSRDDGRIALFAMDFQDADRSRLLFSHDDVDLAGAQWLGSPPRFVSATFITEQLNVRYFDEHVRRVYSLLEERFPGAQIRIVDENRERRYYLAVVSDDRDAGAYYVIDTVDRSVTMLSRNRDALDGRALAPIERISYTARDGTSIPAYLTRPIANGSSRRAAIVLPHGGPSRRDYRRFDYLVQFFAAQGYTVLQSNFRGSRGYGVGWEGDGGFRDWRQVVADITDGTRYLATSGIAAPDRICVAGWSFGGYAALLSVIEEPQLYQCAVSIAGVTDPRALGIYSKNYVGGRAAQVFIGTDREVTRAGSPLRRVDEITTPLRLFHAKYDGDVPLKQSRDLARALAKSNVDFDFIEYEYAAHDIFPENYRIDMLTRISEFLTEELGH